MPFHTVESLKTRLALLTAKPNPCLNAKAFAKSIYMDVCERVEKDGYVAAGFIETYAEEIESYASQRLQELREENERLMLDIKKALTEIKSVHPQSKESREHRDNAWCILDEALSTHPDKGEPSSREDDFGPINLNEVEPDDLSFLRKSRDDAEADIAIVRKIVTDYVHRYFKEDRKRAFEALDRLAAKEGRRG